MTLDYITAGSAISLDSIAITNTIVTSIIGLAIGIITFFLKRTIADLDNKASKADIHKLWEVANCHATHSDLAKVKEDVDEIHRDIKTFKTDYITKEDFFREQAKTDRKLDRIMDILLEMKGENRG